MKNQRKKSLIAVVALFCCLFLLAYSNAQTKQAIAVDAIADSLQQGKIAEAKKLAHELAKQEKEVYEVMRVLKGPRERKLGPSFSVPETYRVERYLRNLSIRGIKPEVLNAQAKALTRMGYRIAAVAEFCDCEEVYSRNGKPAFKKGIAIWKTTVGDLREAVQDFITEVRARNADGVKATARRLNTSCNRCHAAYR